ncbi:MAG: alpha-amylase family glycosyl hydrolase [Pseudomonadota bacterium]
MPDDADDRPLRVDVLRERLALAYPSHTADALVGRIADLAGRYRDTIPERANRWVDQTDVMLIAYGDSILDGERPPLAVLSDVLDRHVGDTVPDVHILPFYPYSSDDGFSVIDYRAVNGHVGTWDDVAMLAERYGLMFDAVINHVSRQSTWFEGFVADDPAYADYFIVADPDLDYSQVTRPRALPLLTPVETASGAKHTWTTFSADQIDLNYANPDVLIEIIDLLLFYAQRGARFIRLDAIGFLWKQIGTTCMHLPQTHALIQVMRQVLDYAAPGTLLITETNVPHQDNISYFGDGTNEAHLVYQFPLPPLTLHAFQTGNARPLSDWAASLEPTTPSTTYFNFLASHDGIGLRPVEDILTREQVAAMADRVRSSGGLVSMRALPDGGTASYELNISYIDAVALPDDTDAVRAAKFLAAQTILLSVVGVPGIYIHSLLGSRSDHAGVERTGQNRSINRERLWLSELEAELTEPDSLRHRVLDGYRRLLTIRRQRTAFHPNVAQRVVRVDDRVFSIVREAPDDRVWVLVNVSDQGIRLALDPADIGLSAAGSLRDLISGRADVLGGKTREVCLEPYQALWLTQ